MKYKPATYTTFANHLVKIAEDQKKAEEKDARRKARRKERQQGGSEQMETVSDHCDQKTDATCKQSTTTRMETRFTEQAFASQSNVLKQPEVETCSNFAVVDEADAELEQVSRTRTQDYDNAAFNLNVDESVGFTANNPFLQKKT